ncbi:hypothetical protein HMPREF9455_04010 [Dysgonomonas gadei ATCC BAA-286]|jgi:hypothetical protein|uniref:Uncharacterized protein n=1 Tax=Dysgonomonas gadei ATCC BAA-286 TaxID=742766 RepID=F5J3U3_9BACT|nr:hypothetical protein HMPREF9455_04010 [Dysgonomonas gadei ATCC BAA-286]
MTRKMRGMTYPGHIYGYEEIYYRKNIKLNQIFNYENKKHHEK